MPARVYIETTIPSAYHTKRTSVFALTRKQATREWWDKRGGDYELFTSRTVLNELRRGVSELVAARIEMLESVKLLDELPVVSDITEMYLKHHLMPQDAFGDARHLALASYFGCDFLLTWNCAHLANANKFSHIGRVNKLLKLPTPVIVTPFELLGYNMP